MKKRKRQIDRLHIGDLLVALLTIVSVVSFNYFASSQPNQKIPNYDSLSSPSTSDDQPSTIPISPSPTPIITLEPTPACSPRDESNESASIPKPSTPEFTAQFELCSIYVQPSYSTSTNPYTGETTNITLGGYYLYNKTIKFTINNQLIINSINNITYNLYYNIRVKGHFSGDWSEIYSYSSYLKSTPNSEYTIVSIPAYDYPSNGQVDFQVEAIIGHMAQVEVCDMPLYPPRGVYTTSVFELDESSGWSDTQTLTMP
jgi:hypothetical protein